MAFAVVQANVYDMENLPDYDVYNVRHGEMFANEADAQDFANRMNDAPVGAMWFHYVLPAADAQAVVVG